MMKTKLSIIAATTALILFSSCEKNSRSQEENTPTPIGFVNPRVVGSTKALDMFTTMPVGTQIGVYADLVTGGTAADAFVFMGQNTAVTFTTGDKGVGAWTYAPMSYWPVAAETTLDFFAYHPWSEKQANELHTTATGTSKPKLSSASEFEITHWVNKDPKQQTDLLWDWVTGATKAQPSGVPNRVGATVTSLEFKHALSKVKFTTKLEKKLDPSTEIFITGLKITAFQKGIITTNKTNTSTLLPTWGTATDQATFIVLENAHNFRKYEVALEMTHFNIAGGEPTDYQLLMIPQTEGGIEITLNYEVVTGRGAVGTPGVAQKGTKVSKVDQAWLQGTQYTYNYVLALDKISFTIDVVSWEDDNTGALEAK